MGSGLLFSVGVRVVPLHGFFNWVLCWGLSVEFAYVEV